MCPVRGGGWGRTRAGRPSRGVQEEARPAVAPAGAWRGGFGSPEGGPRGEGAAVPAEAVCHSQFDTGSGDVSLAAGVLWACEVQFNAAGVRCAAVPARTVPAFGAVLGSVWPSGSAGIPRPRGRAELCRARGSDGAL